MAPPRHGRPLPLRRSQATTPVVTTKIQPRLMCACRPLICSDMIRQRAQNQLTPLSSLRCTFIRKRERMLYPSGTTQFFAINFWFTKINAPGYWGGPSTKYFGLTRGALTTYFPAIVIVLSVCCWLRIQVLLCLYWAILLFQNTF